MEGEEAGEGQRGRPGLVHPDRARLDLAGGEHHKVAEGPAARVAGGKGGPNLEREAKESKDISKIYSVCKSAIRDHGEVGVFLT